jgi:hypothetical protein
MTMLTIDGALITAYIAVGLNLSTAYEGEDFTPPKDGSSWASLTIVPAVIDYNSLGVNGTDLHTGFMQVDFNVKQGTGRAVLLGYAESMRAQFVGGKGFTLTGQNVRITTVDRSPVRAVDGWQRISVTVNWEAETIRPTI